MNRTRVKVLGLCVAYRFGMGLVLAAPLSVAVAATTGEHPRSDAVLWEPGGYPLVDAALRVADTAAAALAAGAMGWLALAFGWLLLLAALIAHLGDDARGGGALLSVALGRFAPLAVLFAANLVGQAVLFGGAAWLGRRLATPDESGDMLRAACLTAAFVLAALLAIGHDAARVVCVEERPGMWQLINRSFELLRERPLSTLGVAASRGLAAWLVLGGGIVFASPLYLGGTAHLVGALACQIAAIAAFVGLRASWLSWLSGLRTATAQARSS